MKLVQIASPDPKESPSGQMVFMDERSQTLPAAETGREWVILVVDDEPAVFEVTKLALSNYRFRDRGLKLLQATNEAQAQETLSREKNIALAILDVVMENQDSGLRLVKYIRNHLSNHQIQIILRTGQPSDIPEEQVVQSYAINDYKLKTELTRDRMFTCLTLALRSYEQCKNVFDLASRLMVTNSKLMSLNANLESQVKERTLQLNDKSVELEQALVEIRNLLRIVTHDQNNYLAITSASAEIISRLNADPVIKKRVDSILWAVYAQRDIVRKITSLDAIKTGKTSYDIQPALLTNVLENVRLTFEEQVFKKQLNFHVLNQCPPETHIFVDATIFVSSVLNNLISNAIKFSIPEGKIFIMAKFDERVEPPLAPRILIKVIDQGIGIPKNLLDTLFSFTTRTTRIGTKGEQGTGFGMPIVKTLLEKMGGTLEVQSQVLEEGRTSESPHGTTFILTVRQANPKS